MLLTVRQAFRESLFLYHMQRNTFLKLILNSDLFYNLYYFPYIFIVAVNSAMCLFLSNKKYL